MEAFSTQKDIIYYITKLLSPSELVIARQVNRVWNEVITGQFTHEFRIGYDYIHNKSTFEWACCYGFGIPAVDRISIYSEARSYSFWHKIKFQNYSVYLSHISFVKVLPIIARFDIDLAIDLCKDNGTYLSEELQECVLRAVVKRNSINLYNKYENLINKVSDICLQNITEYAIIHNADNLIPYLLKKNQLSSLNWKKILTQGHLSSYLLIDLTNSGVISSYPLICCSILRGRVDILNHFKHVFYSNSTFILFAVKHGKVTALEWIYSAIIGAPQKICTAINNTTPLKVAIIRWIATKKESISITTPAIQTLAYTLLPESSIFIEEKNREYSTKYINTVIEFGDFEKIRQYITLCDMSQLTGHKIVLTAIKTNNADIVDYIKLTGYFLIDRPAFNYAISKSKIEIIEILMPLFLPTTCRDHVNVAITANRIRVTKLLIEQGFPYQKMRLLNSLLRTIAMP
jgi:hypothetical protein